MTALTALTVGRGNHLVGPRWSKFAALLDLSSILGSGIKIHRKLLRMLHTHLMLRGFQGEVPRRPQVSPFQIQTAEQSAPPQLAWTSGRFGSAWQRHRAEKPRPAMLRCARCAREQWQSVAERGRAWQSTTVDGQCMANAWQPFGKDQG